MDIEALKAALRYEPETGRLYWRTDRGKKIKAGTEAGSLSHFGYVDVRINKRLLKAHRIAWALVHGTWPDDQIDHINGDRTDNRLCNLRAASNAENTRNGKLRSTNKSGFKGVSWSAGAKKWMAQITVGGKNHYLGLHDSAETAHAAYAAAAVKMHGAFARIA